MYLFFVFKQKPAYEMRISDWSSDVCSSDLPGYAGGQRTAGMIGRRSLRVMAAHSPRFSLAPRASCASPIALIASSDGGELCHNLFGAVLLDSLRDGRRIAPVHAADLHLPKCS